MMMPQHKLLVVASRDYDVATGTGRHAIMSRLIKALKARAEVAEFLPEMATSRGLMNTISAVVTRSIIRSSPLQVALYDSSRNADRLRDLFADFNPTHVYIEGTRLLPVYLRAIKNLRHHGPNPTVILDIDDLMCRRYSIYRKRQFGLDLGVMAGGLSKVVAWLGAPIQDCVLMLESHRMKKLEIFAAKFGDKVILSSRYEAKMLYRLSGECSTKFYNHVIGYEDKPCAFSKPSGQLTFGFIGGDGLLQNRLAIASLMDFWKHEKPDSRLLIAGRMKGSYTQIPNVTLAGFVPNIADFYSQLDAVIILPEVRGGLKTKVIESLAYGVPAIVNDIGREGINGISFLPYCRDFVELKRFIFRDKETVRSELWNMRPRIRSTMKEYWSDNSLQILLDKLLERSI